MLNDLTFCELKEKEVINVYDGKKLGRLLDIAFTPSGHITGFIVPGEKKFLKNITCQDSIFVPWKCIIRIGEDTILVELSDRNPPAQPQCNC